MKKAVIFDMDGLLIDSEPLWQEAEVDEFNKVGVPLTYELCVHTTGMRMDEVVAHWYAQYPWDKPSREDVTKRIIERVTALILEKGEPKEGVEKIISFFQEKGMTLALASSSYYRVIHAVLEKFQLQDVFEVVYSAEDEEYGKPHPGIYITTASKLGVKPRNCIAIEDSFNGVLAAKAAKMTCIAVPDTYIEYNEKLIIADAELTSLAEMNDAVWDRLQK